MFTVYGVDGPLAKPMKVVANLINTCLAHICSIVLSAAVFRDVHTYHEFVGHEGTSADNLNHHRSISIFPLFSKIAKKVIYKKVTNSLNASNVITNEQNAFQKGKSTEKALLNIRKRIINNRKPKVSKVL